MPLHTKKKYNCMIIINTVINKWSDNFNHKVSLCFVFFFFAALSSIQILSNCLLLLIFLR